VTIGGVDDVGLNREVVANEIGRIGVVRDDTADLGGGQKHELGPLGREKTLDGGRVAELELAVRRAQQALVAARRQGAHDRGADEAARTGDEHLGVGRHSWCL
jgi:hypothetical protein